MMIYSILFGFIGSVIGLAFSYVYDIPSGAAIIFCLVVIYAITKTAFLLRRKS